jgi:hypothetical protein
MDGTGITKKVECGGCQTAVMIKVRWLFKDVNIELVARKKVPAEIHGFYFMRAGQ